MDIKVLGTGCAKCKTLEMATQQAVAELSLDAVIEKIEDIQKIMIYGIMSTPGLVINNKVVLSGQVPKVSELKEILMKNF
jgi:small redox-active disulfide protein 2